MNERVRRILVFVTIVAAGTLLIFIDLPLIIILPLIIVIGIILLILLGAIPISELKTILSSRKTNGSKKASADSGTKKPVTKTSAIQVTPEKKIARFSFGSLFKGKVTAGSGTASKPQQITAAKTGKKPGFISKFGSLFARKGAKLSPALAPKQRAVSGEKSGVSLHTSSLISSVKALGTILTTRKKADPDKLKKIDNMLDLAVSGKVETSSSSATISPGKISAAPAANGSAGGGGSVTVPSGTLGDEDALFSLSDEDLDAGLLDGLDDDSTSGARISRGGESVDDTLPLQEGEIAIPAGEAGDTAVPDDISAAADDILKSSGEELADDLPALDSLGSTEGDLGDLDSISLDSVELDEDEEDSEPAPPAPAPAPAAAAPNLSMPAAAPSPALSKDTGRSDQQEMAAFAAASGGDDDMLSSLAASIKTVRKEQDLSLLRDLKDFRAPGTKIETELTELYTTLNAATERQKKLRPSQKKAQPK
jgi:hypothetical protein